MRSFFLFPLVIVAALAGGAAGAQAQVQAQDSDLAVAFGEAWLQLLDGGDYADCWKQASPSFRSTFQESTWEDEVKAARTNFGLLKSRSLEKVIHTGTDYTVVRFLSDFDNRKKVSEMITLVRLDGQWRAESYRIH